MWQALFQALERMYRARSLPSRSPHASEHGREVREVGGRPAGGKWNHLTEGKLRPSKVLLAQATELVIDRTGFEPMSV